MELLDNITTIEEAIIALLSHPNALKYDKDALTKRFTKEFTEEKMLALSLCGTANGHIALGFMKGTKSAIKPFLANVADNGEQSIPLIIRAINIRLTKEISDNDVASMETSEHLEQ